MSFKLNKHSVYDFMENRKNGLMFKQLRFLKLILYFVSWLMIHGRVYFNFY